MENINIIIIIHRFSAFPEAHKNLFIEDGLPQRPGRFGNIRVRTRRELQVILAIYIKKEKRRNSNTIFFLSAIDLDISRERLKLFNILSKHLCG